MAPYHLKFKRKTEPEGEYSWHNVILEWLLIDMADLKRKGVATDENNAQLKRKQKITMQLTCLQSTTRINQKFTTDTQLICHQLSAGAWYGIIPYY